MPRRKTNGKPRRQPCHAISSPHRFQGNAMVKVEERRDLQARINAMQPDDLCPCCRGTGVNGGERCEWCGGWGEYSHD